MNTLLDTARRWYDFGVATIPIRYGSKKPAVRWQRYTDTLPRGDELASWWPNDTGPSYGIAVLTGWQGLAVIDFDDLWTFSEWLIQLSPSLARLALTTFRVNTSKGIHLYFTTDEPTITRSFKQQGILIDLRGAGGYAIAPPSIHPTGAEYQGVGRLEDIKRIDSVYTLLPELEGFEKWVTVPQVPAAPEQDLWERVSQHKSSVAIDVIKSNHSIHDMLGVPRNGRAYTTLLCPLHQETTPSFALYANDRFACFGCSARGDIIDFWALKNHITLQEAISELGSMINA